MQYINNILLVRDSHDLSLLFFHVNIFYEEDVGKGGVVALFENLGSSNSFANKMRSTNYHEQ